MRRLRIGSTSRRASREAPMPPMGFPWRLWHPCASRLRQARLVRVETDTGGPSRATFHGRFATVASTRRCSSGAAAAQARRRAGVGLQARPRRVRDSEAGGAWTRRRAGRRRVRDRGLGSGPGDPAPLRATVSLRRVENTEIMAEHAPRHQRLDARATRWPASNRVTGPPGYPGRQCRAGAENPQPDMPGRPEWLGGPA